jgi:hypothetical protein
MLAVMLILLLATATAAISVQATGFEMRASGHGRRAMQARLVSEAGLALTVSRIDVLGAASVEASFKALEKNPDQIPSGAVFNEPDCRYPTADRPGDNGCNRFDHYFTSSSVTDFMQPAFTRSPMTAAAIGDNQGYQPWFAIDMRYDEDDPKPIPGFRAEGGGTMKFIRVNLVARGGTVYNGSGVRSARTIHTSCASLKLGPLMSF